MRRTKDTKINGIPIISLPGKNQKTEDVELNPEERSH